MPFFFKKRKGFIYVFHVYMCRPECVYTYADTNECQMTACSVCVCICVQMRMNAREAFDPLELEFLAVCESPDVSAGNRTPVFCKGASPIAEPQSPD